MGKKDSDPIDAPPIPSERDTVHKFGLRRSAREKTLHDLGDEVRSQCRADDAPDQVVAVMAVVIRLDGKGKPTEVRRFMCVWGEPAFEALVRASEDTLKHVGRRLMAARAEKMN